MHSSVEIDFQQNGKQETTMGKYPVTRIPVAETEAKEKRIQFLSSQGTFLEDTNSLRRAFTSRISRFAWVKLQNTHQTGPRTVAAGVGGSLRAGGFISLYPWAVTAAVAVVNTWQMAWEDKTGEPKSWGRRNRLQTEA